MEDGVTGGGVCAGLLYKMSADSTSFICPVLLLGDAGAFVATDSMGATAVDVISVIALLGSR